MPKRLLDGTFHEFWYGQKRYRPSGQSPIIFRLALSPTLFSPPNTRSSLKFLTPLSTVPRLLTIALGLMSPDSQIGLPTWKNLLQCQAIQSVQTDLDGTLKFGWWCCRHYHFHWNNDLIPFYYHTGGWTEIYTPAESLLSPKEPSIKSDCCRLIRCCCERKTALLHCNAASISTRGRTHTKPTARSCRNLSFLIFFTRLHRGVHGCQPVL